MKRNQQEVIDRILDLLTELVDDEPAEKQAKTPPMEMLTIRECFCHNDSPFYNPSPYPATMPITADSRIIFIG